MMTILLQAAQQSPFGGSSLLMFGLILVVMYLFMIRPQARKQKEEKVFRESVAKGLKVVTNGGIHGKISEVRETSIILEVEGGTKLKVERSAISKELSSQYVNNDKTEKPEKKEYNKEEKEASKN